MPAPRPILKGLPSSYVSSESASNPLPFSSCPNIVDSPHVHFPPTPTLTSTEITHSSFIYDRAPIVVTPNVCALPERGGRKFIGSTNGNQNQGGGLGYFHPHAKFQVNTVRVERDSVVETVSPTIFSASVTVGNVNECGSVELYMKKRSGPMYDYDYDYDQYSSSTHDQQQQQHTTQHAEHVVSSLLFDHSSGSSDLGVFYTPPPCIPTPSSSSSSSSSSISHSSFSLSPRNGYNNTSTSPSPTAGSSSSNNNNTPSHQDKKKTSVDVGGGGGGRKKRLRNREYTTTTTENRVEGEYRTKRMLTPASYTSPEVELEGCLGGF